MKVGTDQLLSLLDEEARKIGVDPKVARALLLSENSSYGPDGKLNTRGEIDTDTVSPAGASGIMQVMPTTAANLQRMGYLATTDDLSTPVGQVRAGLATIKEMNDRGINSPAEIAVAYNGGGASLQAFRDGRNLNGETTTYLKKFNQHFGGNMADAPTSSSTTTREGYSTSRRDIDPQKAAYINARLDDANARAGDTSAQVRQLAQGILGDTALQQEAITAGSQAEVARLEAETKQKTQTLDNTEGILTKFGINMNTENLIAEKMQLIRANSNERAELMNGIGALENESPLTNPVGWLINQVKQYPLIQRHNALKQQGDAAARDIEIAQGLARNQQVLQPAHIQDAINAEQLAKTNAVLAKAGYDKAALSGAARAKVAALLIDSDNVNGTNLRMNIDWLQGSSAQTSETFSTNTKEREEVDKLKPVNAAVAVLGLEPFTPTTFKSMDKDTQNAWVKNAQFGRLGASPGAAISLLNDTFSTAGLGNINKNSPIVGKHLQEIVRQGQDTFDALNVQAMSNLKLQSQLKNLKTPMEQLAFGIDEWAKKKEQELKEGNYGKLPVDNPYKLQYAYIAGTKELQDNPYSQLITQKKQMGITVDDNLLLASALADVNTGKKSLGQVAEELQTFYKKGHDIQRRDTAATAVGFHPLEKYPVTTRLTTFSSSSVDLFNKQSIENFLVRQAAAQRTSNVTSFNAMGDFSQ